MSELKASGLWISEVLDSSACGGSAEGRKIHRLTLFSS